ncbi:MAG: ABC-2 family transporter protein [Chloroflexota bacterium]|nr:ABC-2 family transporter protein [Chloroflexota bacterium]
MIKALGLAKYVKTASMAATGAAGDSPLFLLDYLLRFLRVALLITVWRTILATSAPAAGLSLDAVLTYTLIAAVFADPLAARTGLEEALWNGSIATRFLQPMAVVGHYASEMVGSWLLGLALFSLPLLLAAPLLGVDPLPAGGGAALLFPISLVLGVSVGMAVDFLFCALMVTFGWSVWEVERWRSALSTVLSGALLPLSVLPWGLGDVLAWLPFAAMAWAPLSIYTGLGDPLRLLALQAFWAVVLWLLAQRLWRACRQKVVIYGG